ncbi:MAG: hypothetical protein ACO3QA_12500 [Phycisphaerales bacterium]
MATPPPRARARVRGVGRLLAPVDVRGAGLGKRSCRSIASGRMLGRSPERAPVNRPILRWLRIVSDRLETLAVQLAAQLEDQRDEPVRACDGRATRAAKAKSSAVLKQANWKWDSNS